MYVSTQFKLRVSEELVSSLETAARNHSRRSAQQVAEEIIQTYLPFWEQAEQVKQNRIAQQREALFGPPDRPGQVEAEQPPPFRRRSPNRRERKK